MITNEEINQANRNFVSVMCENKKNYQPYFSSGPSTMTDVDVFPYTRNFRGRFDVEKAIVLDREAGWREMRTNCYKPVDKHDIKYYPNHCFQGAPSTTYPCYPEYLRKYSDKTALGLQLFKTGVNEYR